eukprot:1154955-Pelagomonas_calceolata.AAC.6
MQHETEQPLVVPLPLSKSPEYLRKAKNHVGNENTPYVISGKGETLAKRAVSIPHIAYPCKEYVEIPPKSIKEKEMPSRAVAPHNPSTKRKRNVNGDQEG